MDIYRKVWSPDGAMFEVTPEKASELVLNEGWSNTPPKAKKSRDTKSPTPKEEVKLAADTEATEGEE